MHASDFRKIDLVCAQEEDRPELQCVYLHDGYLYAADGFVAAQIPVDPDEVDIDGAIPVQAIREARTIGGPLIIGEKQVTVPGLSCHFGRIDYERWQAIRKDLDAKVFIRPGMQPHTHNPIVTLDIQRLWNLAQAICDDMPWMEIYLGQSNHGPVLVRPLGCNDGTLGAIMPMCPPMDGKKADLWHALGQLKAAIAEGDSVELRGDLLDELRKVLCVEVKE